MLRSAVGSSEQDAPSLCFQLKADTAAVAGIQRRPAASRQAQHRRQQTPGEPFQSQASQAAHQQLAGECAGVLGSTSQSMFRMLNICYAKCSHVIRELHSTILTGAYCPRLLALQVMLQVKRKVTEQHRGGRDPFGESWGSPSFGSKPQPTARSSSDLWGFEAPEPTKSGKGSSPPAPAQQRGEQLASAGPAASSGDIWDGAFGEDSAQPAAAQSSPSRPKSPGACQLSLLMLLHKCCMTFRRLSAMLQCNTTAAKLRLRPAHAVTQRPPLNVRRLQA